MGILYSDFNDAMKGLYTAFASVARDYIGKTSKCGATYDLRMLGNIFASDMWERLYLVYRENDDKEFTPASFTFAFSFREMKDEQGIDWCNSGDFQYIGMTTKGDILTTVGAHDILNWEKKTAAEKMKCYELYIADLLDNAVKQIRHGGKHKGRSSKKH